MTCRIVLASKSQIRSLLLEKAGIKFGTVDPAIDEKEVKLSYIGNNYPARDIADVLADMKARKISNRFPDSIVIGCDQILDFNSKILSKAKDQDELIHQLKQLQGNKHKLHSACVVYNAQKPEWRFIGSVSMTMRNLSDQYISKYVQDNDLHKIYNKEIINSKRFVRYQVITAWNNVREGNKKQASELINSALINNNKNLLLMQSAIDLKKNNIDVPKNFSHISANFFWYQLLSFINSKIKDPYQFYNFFIVTHHHKLKKILNIRDDKGIATGCCMKIDFSKITSVNIMTVEGGKDDISAPGQCYAALELCTGLNEDKKSSYVEADAGHYGIFAGRYWRNKIRPLVLDVMNKN